MVIFFSQLVIFLKRHHRYYHLLHLQPILNTQRGFKVLFNVHICYYFFTRGLFTLTVSWSNVYISAAGTAWCCQIVQSTIIFAKVQIFAFFLCIPNLFPYKINTYQTLFLLGVGTLREELACTLLSACPSLLSIFASRNEPQATGVRPRTSAPGVGRWSAGCDSAVRTRQPGLTRTTKDALAVAGDVIYSGCVGWKFLQSIGLKLLFFHLYKNESWL